MVVIVIALIALIALAVVVALSPTCTGNRARMARMEAANVRAAASMWLADGHTDCPAVSQLTDEEFLSRVAHAEDPWGNAFVIECEGTEVEVSSAGPDGQLGTIDDVLSAGP